MKNSQKNFWLFPHLLLCAPINFILRTLIAPFILLVFITLYTFSAVYANTMVYSIHLGSFKNFDNAKEEVSRLKRSGFDSFYRYETVKGLGKWYRVYIGKYGSKIEAEKEAGALKDTGLVSYFTITIPDQMANGRLGKSDNQSNSYVLYIGFFTERSNGDRLVRKLKAFGLNSFLAEEEVSGNRWYRAYVLPFHDEHEAVSTGLELKSKGLIQYYRPVLLDPSLSEKYYVPGDRREPMNFSGGIDSDGERNAGSGLQEEGDFSERYEMRGGTEKGGRERISHINHEEEQIQLTIAHEKGYYEEGENIDAKEGFGKSEGMIRGVGKEEIIVSNSKEIIDSFPQEPYNLENKYRMIESEEGEEIESVYDSKVFGEEIEEIHIPEEGYGRRSGFKR
ncbi:MAG: SPOR domain-containing protein [Thermodesulfobacteriota bacterium]|nr:SPOR domain-containing protein [Thermodesulfobacteriota bacterium]